MKKKIISITLALIMLLNFTLFTKKVEASSFIDVADTHWAINYINFMQNYGIINGYGDGTYRPENEVKHGEFIKMLVLCRWKVKPNENLPEGVHWSVPYAEIGHGFIINIYTYNYEKYEAKITREDAVKMLWKMYKIINHGIKVNEDEKYLKLFKDESTIIDEEAREAFNACVQIGLINGFEDETLRPNSTLTSAQATKLLYGLYSM